MKKKILSLILCITIVFYSTFTVNVPKAKAWPVSITVANMLPESMTTAAGWAKIAQDAGKWVVDKLAAFAISGMKISALLTIQEATKLIIGGPKGDTLIHDYNNYLYTSPQQIALANMNTFFNTVSKGRASSLNYEGVGPNYDAYLIGQARQSIAGQPFVTNLQDQVTDPSQMFSNGNMKGVTAYLQCANNVMCYTLTANAKYNQEFDKAQTIAKNEAVNGFLPRKVNGRITQPASLAQSALTQIDQLGTQIIMAVDPNEDKTAAALEITQGAFISLSARLTNYGISDDAGKEALRNKNDQFPFSLSYTTKAGVAMTAGGATSSMGVGAITSCNNKYDTQQCCTSNGGKWVNNKCTT